MSGRAESSLIIKCVSTQKKSDDVVIDGSIPNRSQVGSDDYIASCTCMCGKFLSHRL